MTVIPAGYFLAAYQFDSPSPGGTRRSVVTIGHQGLLSLLTMNQLSQSFEEEVWSEIGSSQYTYKGVIGYTETTSFEATQTLPGSLSAAPMSPNVALLVRKLTGSRGRKNRGRNYFPGMIYESDVDGAGVINPVQVGGFQGFFDNWYSALVALEFEPYILHNDETPPTPVLQFEVDGVVATQRRRLRR